jgi:putative transposase
MSNYNEIMHGRHYFYSLHVHLVFISEYRRGLFDADAIERLPAVFGKVCTDFDAVLVEMDGGEDHVHLLVEYPQLEGCVQSSATQRAPRRSAQVL